jgi:hypothetical protein
MPFHSEARLEGWHSDPKHFAPFLETQIAGHRRWSAFVALGEHLEEQYGFGLGQWHEAQLVNDEQLVAGDLPLDAEQFFGVTGLDQFADLSGSGCKAHTMATLASRQAQSAGGLRDTHSRLVTRFQSRCRHSGSIPPIDYVSQEMFILRHRLALHSTLVVSPWRRFSPCGAKVVFQRDSNPADHFDKGKHVFTRGRSQHLSIGSR